MRVHDWRTPFEQACSMAKMKPEHVHNMLILECKSSVARLKLFFITHPLNSIRPRPGNDMSVYRPVLQFPRIENGSDCLNLKV